MSKHFAGKSALINPAWELEPEPPSARVAAQRRHASFEDSPSPISLHKQHHQAAPSVSTVYHFDNSCFATLICKPTYTITDLSTSPLTSTPSLALARITHASQLHRHTRVFRTHHSILQRKSSCSDPSPCQLLTCLFIYFQTFQTRTADTKP